MTDMQTKTEAPAELEGLAEQIVGRGRAALVERLRSAYRAAAATHADLVTIAPDRLEAMVQDAAGRADGLQWRRALAEVAASELGITVGEALTHPAVTEAQRLVGAPSYEQSLAELIARPVPAIVPVASGQQVAPLTNESQQAPEPVPIGYETELYDVVASFTEETDGEDHTVGSEAPPASSAPTPARSAVPAQPAAPAPWETLSEALDEKPGGALVPVSSEPDELVVPAVHEGGVANLPKRHDGLGVCISSAGVDILEGEHEILGRLLWDEIDTLQVISLRPKRRHPEPRARLIIRTPQGDASFGIPGITGDELRDRVKPLLDRYGHNSLA